MKPEIEVELVGEPMGKGRPRFLRGSGRTYTPPTTAKYENRLKAAAKKAMEGKHILDGPVRIRVMAFFQIPKSVSARTRRSMVQGFEWPTKKPDLDNVLKMAMDALNAVVWLDDKQVVADKTTKHWGENPGLAVYVWRL